MKTMNKEYDFVVVGGGMSGICAAIAAARKGLKTALLQNRPVLGGNASSEIRVDINGASRHGEIKNVRETGIILELLHAAKHVNPQYSFHVFETILWEKTRYQDNLDLYLNTHFYDATVEDNKITSIKAIQQTTETIFEFKAKHFADTSGDAVLAFESGAQWTIGREAKSEHNEEHAPEIADRHTMGSTIMFSTKDMGHYVPYEKPKWAHTFTKDMLASRDISNLRFGYWWIELEAQELSIIEEAEDIREELLRWVYGIFDYIKNSGEYDADNLALDWICSVPGRRESRRVIGDYMLNENDVYCGRRFEDAVAYGGWTMDVHSVGGLRAKGNDEEGTMWLPITDIYTIPYRCIYSKNIENLFVGGRVISATHMALSSTRVMATCAVIGQAIGTAAGIAFFENLTCRDVAKHMNKLQQTLIKDDCFLPGIAKNDPDDLCLDAQISASSFIKGGEASNINNGVSRKTGCDENAWISEKLSKDKPQWVSIHLKNKSLLKEIHIKFDPNLSDTLITSATFSTQQKQVPDMPYELVKDYSVELLSDGKIVYREEITGNLQRLNLLCFSKPIQCNEVKITVFSTYGDNHARVFEVNLYSNK